MKFHLLFIAAAVVLTGGVFAVPSYTGDSDGAKDSSIPSDINTSVDIEAELGVIWGYDRNTGFSGFREILDLDLLLELNSFGSYQSDNSGLRYNEPQGVAMVAGGHLKFEVNNQSGDLSATDIEKISINYEDIYGRILLDPFYLHIAGSSKGNHFRRINGYTFLKSTSRIQANWAHMGYRVQWAGIVSPDFWRLSGSADKITNAYAEAFVGLGYVGRLAEMMLAVGSPADWETNDGVYDLGFSFESNPVGALLLNGAVVYGTGYDVTPLGFGSSVGYALDATSSLTLVPHVGLDGDFEGTEDKPFEYLATDFVGGVSLEWPGSTGWGYDPLANKESNRFSGLDLSVGYYTPGSEDPKSVTSVAFSIFEDTVAGLIPMVGLVGVYEIHDVTEAVGDKFTTYGVYLDCDLWGQFVPFTRILKTDAKTDADTSLEVGVELHLIPNTTITPRFETTAITDLDTDKGLFSIEAIVTF